MSAPSSEPKTKDFEIVFEPGDKIEVIKQGSRFEHKVGEVVACGIYYSVILEEGMHLRLKDSEMKTI